MLIAIYFFIKMMVLPEIGAYAQALLEPIMLIVIISSGILMLFGAVGMHISSNLGSTVISSIFRAIGYIARTIIQAIAWIIRNTFRLMPRVFNGSRRTFNQLGMNAWVSNLLSVIVAIIFLVIVI